MTALLCKRTTAGTSCLITSLKKGVFFFFFYEQPQFRRLQHLLQPGKYRQFSDWGTMTARVGSFQPTLDIS